MGIVNCTPDSFSDGGRFLEPEAALAHAERLLDDGAEILDIGGESTRPGARAVPAEEELARTLPVVTEIRRRHPGVPLSIDTSKASVARQALAAGVDLVNDVTAGRDPEMFDTVATAEGAAIALMHMRGEPRTMQVDTSYTHVVAEVHASLRDRARSACAAGIPKASVWLDPGIGFGKDDRGNRALIAALPDLACLGHPVIVGASNKSFIGRATGAPVDRRLPGSLAALIPVLGNFRAAVRVHDVAATVQFLDIACSLPESAA
jgi:dihydropteroate synthase